MDTTAQQHTFEHVLVQNNLFPLLRDRLSELQINLGYLCNQACEHCHVEAGPKRKEIMSWPTMQRIFDWIDDNGIERVDLTGGAPEMNPNFRRFVDQLLDRHIAVAVRCNLTILIEPDQLDLADWYGQRSIRLVCSLPCYTQGNVDKQRGKDVFDKSIAALLQLNRCGYGIQDDKVLDLVYNPLGATLPPSQMSLQRDYQKRLLDDYGIRFNNLLTLTNLPIKRFAHFLKRNQQIDSYQQLLIDSFNPDTVEPLMCRHLLSVDWCGDIYDCDFNQILNLPTTFGTSKLWRINAEQLHNAPISLDSHCFGCTAGAGSSCGGALT